MRCGRYGEMYASPSLLQLLWKRAQEPLEEVELLNLSGNKISMRDTSLPNEAYSLYVFVCLVKVG